MELDLGSLVQFILLGVFSSFCSSLAKLSSGILMLLILSFLLAPMFKASKIFMQFLFPCALNIREESYWARLLHDMPRVSLDLMP